MSAELRRGPLRVLLADGDTRDHLCGIAPEPRGRTALQWTPWALARREDAGGNLATRQAPLLAGVHVVGRAGHDDGLPGFLADSRPDSWGRLLIDRQLRRRGVSPASLSGVDRLAIVGARGPGALIYEPEAPLDDLDAHAAIDLDALAADCELVLAGDEPAMLDRLQAAGGSAGGSRPKAWIAETPSGSLRSGAHALDPGETGWIVKFRAPQHAPVDVGPLEYAYALMARAAGLEIAEPRLFETPRGRYFGSRRFDRVDGRRVHVLSVAGLLDVAPEQAMAADYLDLLKLTRHVTRSAAEVDMAYRHAVFNVLAHNRDDHLKQFAFRRVGGAWTRAPAYDLTFCDGPRGEHTLLVAGEGRHPGVEHLRALARQGGIKPVVAERILGEVRDALRRWPEWATEAGVSAPSKGMVASAIDVALAAP